MHKIIFFNSGKLFTTPTDTEKNTLNIPSTHRKHNVKKCPFHNILSQVRFQENLKISKQKLPHFAKENFYDYLICVF